MFTLRAARVYEHSARVHETKMFTLRAIHSCLRIRIFEFVFATSSLRLFVCDFVFATFRLMVYAHVISTHTHRKSTLLVLCSFAGSILLRSLSLRVSSRLYYVSITFLRSPCCFAFLSSRHDSYPKHNRIKNRYARSDYDRPA